MMQSTETAPKRPRGRPADTLGEHDLSDKLKAAREVFADHALHQNGAVQKAMKDIYGSMPSESHFSSVIGGNKPLSRRFLDALHAAFSLPTYELASSIWIELATDQFRKKLTDARFSDPRLVLRQIAITPPWLGIIRSQQMLAAIGAPPRSARPWVFIGETVKLEVRMPFDGYLTVLSCDPKAADGKACFYWLDPLLGLDGEKLDQGRYLLPPTGEGLPVGGEPSDSTVIALATREPISLPWHKEIREGIPIECLRRFVTSIKGLGDQHRQISVLEFDVRYPA